MRICFENVQISAKAMHRPSYVSFEKKGMFLTGRTIEGVQDRSEKQ
jgi:hypothetical protein